MDDYQDHDAVGLAGLVRAKQVSAQELLEAARARADQVNDRINAVVVDIDPPRSSETGRESGPFAGVPFLLKDLGQDLEGYPTSGGSRSLATTPVAENATVVQRSITSLAAWNTGRRSLNFGTTTGAGALA